MPVEIVLTLDPQFEDKILRPSGVVGEYIQDIATATEYWAWRYSPVDTGKLRDSLRSYRLELATWLVEARTEYAQFVHEGTRQGMGNYIIRPRRAKALRWYGPNGPIFAAWVSHPGIQPNPFMLDALEKVMSGPASNRTTRTSVVQAI